MDQLPSHNTHPSKREVDDNTTTRDGENRTKPRLWCSYTQYENSISNMASYYVLYIPTLIPQTRNLPGEVKWKVASGSNASSERPA